ncbi:MAG: hypothetical protein R6V48_01975 [Fidelibacterota bacterium]
MQNRVLYYITIVCLAGISFAFAFENALFWQPSFREDISQPLNAYYLTGNPAAYLYEGNFQEIRIGGRFDKMDYRRRYDPVSEQNLHAEFFTVRDIDNKSFFSTGISYDDYRKRDLFASMEKDFYDDYFSMIDSTQGDVSYYGPRLQILYNVKLSENVFFGLEGNYGVERSLKDTFPQTITIMRNSGYRAGLDFRKNAFNMGVFARYYDDQISYEAVKSYTNVKSHTYIGYNIFYNELPGSKTEKIRTRNGLEYGANLGFGKKTGFYGDFAVSGLHRISRSELIRASHTYDRGLWLRQGLHVRGNLNYYSGEVAAFRFYGELLQYEDWAESLISGALVIENNERMARWGGMFIYKPSLVQEAYLGAESGTVHYDYIEYVFPFESSRSGNEWKLYTGSRLYVGPKTHFHVDLAYAKMIPRFYWDTESFRDTNIIIGLEQLFSFGYITIGFEYINRKPENDVETISKYLFGLSYLRK